MRLVISVFFYAGWVAFVIAASFLQPRHAHLPFWVRLALGGVFAMAWGAWHRSGGA